MSKIFFSDERLLAELRSETSEAGLRATATRLQFTPQFILDVVKGRRQLSSRLAEAMGYRRVVLYERLTKQSSSSLNG